MGSDNALATCLHPKSKIGLDARKEVGDAPNWCTVLISIFVPSEFLIRRGMPQEFFEDNFSGSIVAWTLREEKKRSSLARTGLFLSIARTNNGPIRHFWGRKKDAARFPFLASHRIPSFADCEKKFQTIVLPVFDGQSLPIQKWSAECSRATSEHCVQVWKLGLPRSCNRN